MIYFTDINITIWIWMAIYAFLLYIVTFFLYSHVNMTKRQVLLFLPAVFLWTLCETYFTCMPASPFQVVMCNLFELSWLLPTVYLFTDHFALNIIRFSVVSWIANAVSLVVVSAYNYQDALLFANKRLNELSWVSVAIFTVSVVVVILIEYYPIHKLMRYKPEFDKVYNVIAVFYILFIIVDLIIEIKAAINGKYVWRGMFKGLIAGCIVVFIVLLAVIIKRHGLSIQKKQLQNRITYLDEQYADVVARNRELHKVRHELNKQVEALYALKGYVPEKTRKEMINSVKDKLCNDLEGMSLTGNLMLDTLIEKHYKELKEKNILLVTVLTPVKFSKATEDDIITIQEEMFAFAKSLDYNRKWIRYSIRKRADILFIMLEICFNDDEFNRKQKIIDMIGDKLFLRQAFDQTYSLISRKDGTLNYDIAKDILEIGAMLKI